MKPRDVDLEPLRAIVRKHNLMKSWRDGLFAESAIDQKNIAYKRAIEAKDNYIKIMCSKKNDGSADYRRWALHKATGLSTKGMRAGYGMRASTRRTNRGLN